MKTQIKSWIVTALLKRRDTENAELKARLTVLEELIANLRTKGN